MREELGLDPEQFGNQKESAKPDLFKSVETKEWAMNKVITEKSLLDKFRSGKLAKLVKVLALSTLLSMEACNLSQDEAKGSPKKENSVKGKVSGEQRAAEREHIERIRARAQRKIQENKESEYKAAVRASELATQMNIAFDHNRYQIEQEGGAITSINGVKVPLSMLTDGERANVKKARALKNAGNSSAREQSQGSAVRSSMEFNEIDDF